MIGGYTFLNEAVWGKKDAILRVGPGESDQLNVRFDGEADEGGHAFRVIFTAGDPPAIDPLIEGQLPVEIAFNTPGARVFFDAVPVRRGRTWFTHWATLRWPEKLSLVERRVGARQHVPEDLEIVAVLTLPHGGSSLRARLWDVDLKGAACICPAHPDLPAPEVNQGLGVVLTHHGMEYRLRGCCRNVQRLSSNSIRVGLQFQSEAEYDPGTLVRFRHFLEELHGHGVRQSLRKDLTKTVIFANE